MDKYLKDRAGQEKGRGVSATHVLLVDGSKSVIGYCTIANANLPLNDLPASLARKITKHSLVPANLIARLACDQKHKGQGLGELLLMYSLSVICRLSEDSGSALVIVDAKNESAARFYTKYGFVRLPYHRWLIVDVVRSMFRTPDYPCRMFLPKKTVDQLVRSN